MGILEKISSHDDLVNLTPAEQTALCGEIRQFLVENVSRTGGHLASNLESLSWPWLLRPFLTRGLTG